MAKLKQVFSTDYAERVPASPTKYYTKDDWEKFAADKGISLEIIPMYKARGYTIKMNFIDFMELFVALRNKGMKKTFSPIRTVEIDGKPSEKSNQLSEKLVIDQQTTQEMLSLLSYHKTDGKGRFIRRNMELAESDLVYFERNPKMVWGIYSNEKNTLGVVICRNK